MAKIKMRRNKHRDEVRREVLIHYGNGELKCLQCGFADIRALAISHIRGTRFSKDKGRSGIDLCNWLIKQGYPSGYQTLCMNCRMIKAKEAKGLLV